MSSTSPLSMPRRELCRSRTRSYSPATACGSKARSQECTEGGMIRVWKPLPSSPSKRTSHFQTGLLRCSRPASRGFFATTRSKAPRSRTPSSGPARTWESVAHSVGRALSSTPRRCGAAGGAGGLTAAARPAPGPQRQATQPEARPLPRTQGQALKKTRTRPRGRRPPWKQKPRQPSSSAHRALASSSVRSSTARSPPGASVPWKTVKARMPLTSGALPREARQAVKPPPPSSTPSQLSLNMIVRGPSASGGPSNVNPANLSGRCLHVSFASEIVMASWCAYGGGSIPHCILNERDACPGGCHFIGRILMSLATIGGSTWTSSSVPLSFPRRTPPCSAQCSPSFEELKEKVSSH
mmetsp:Transcript_101449/g.295601  ORF Transcript_101449/g.295601 Transcript_101449/m.295601 type:complete len:354 (+) Transcript_101449:309-1370(+)